MESSSNDLLADKLIVLEESPCGRWSKRKKVLSQKDLVPGVDSAFLAIDAEEGVEVVWNEVLIASKPTGFTDRILSTFDQLVRLNHPNIVRFHKHWIKDEKLIFITEYITYHTLKQYLKMTKKNAKKMSNSTWKRFCSQLLHALRYLHSRLPCIVHGNLCCDSIYVRHNGLLIIGSISAEAIMSYSSHESSQCFHLVGSEFSARITTSVDIYSFGLCALEMATLETSDTSSSVPVEQITNFFDLLDNGVQRSFIESCLSQDPLRRPSAHDLIFHPAVFDFPSLKLISAHKFVNTFLNVSNDAQSELVRNALSAFSQIGDKSEEVVQQLLKFLEEVKIGSYPLPTPDSSSGSRKSFCEPTAKLENSSTFPNEKRRIEKVTTEIKQTSDTDSEIVLSLYMTDKLVRKVRSVLVPADSPRSIAEDLERNGIIHPEDQDRLVTEIYNAVGNGVR